MTKKPSSRSKGFDNVSKVWNPNFLGSTLAGCILGKFVDVSDRISSEFEKLVLEGDSRSRFQKSILEVHSRSRFEKSNGIRSARTVSERSIGVSLRTFN